MTKAKQSLKQAHSNWTQTYPHSRHGQFVDLISAKIGPQEVTLLIALDLLKLRYSTQTG
ncbi:MAG: hypothetical protein ACI9BH_000744, partial [Paracoccaceae bacterium]